MLVSSYNYAQYVVEAVASALEQDEPPLEVIVVDDGSEDESVDRLRAAFGGDARVTLIEQDNAGQLQAWMTGFMHARGDVIAFLDSDDLWKDDYLRQVVDVYVARPDVDFVYTNMEMFGEREGPMLRGTADRDLGVSILLNAYSHRFQGSATSAISLRRGLLEKLFVLPGAQVRNWMSRPDDCLVYGADIFGARKVYLAAMPVLHRMHSASALNDFTCPIKAYRHVVSSEQMIDFYRAAQGITPRWLRMTKAEFRTKPRPTWTELRAYSWLLMQAPMPLGKRIEHWLGILRHYLSTRLSAPRILEGAHHRSGRLATSRSMRAFSARASSSGR